MPDMETPPTADEYHTAVVRFTDAIDRLLAQGRAAQERAHALQRHADALRAQLRPVGALPESEQRELRDLTALQEKLYRDFLGPLESASTGHHLTAPRALAHRHRI